MDSTIGRFSEDIIGWLICLLEDPTDKIQDLEKNKKNEKKQVVEKETKVAIIWDKRKREEISANLAEKQYVNQMVYDRFTVYCDERGWDNFSNKNEFIEALISNIGEEIYRKRLYYRFRLYLERTSEKLKEAVTKAEVKHLIDFLELTDKDDNDQKIKDLVEKLQNMVD